jgi:hypothetical protein
MKFRQIKQGLIDVLETRALASGKFRVIGAQERQMDATENLENFKSVQVFYKRGEIPGAEHGSSDGFKHQMSFGVELTCAEGAKGDISALNNTGDPAGIVTALNNFQDAVYAADESWDELLEEVLQTLMTPVNRDLKLEPTQANPDGFLLGSWQCEEIEKKDPVPYGEYVTVVGMLLFKCKNPEEVVGEVPVPLAPGNIDNDITFSSTEEEDDDVGKAAVKVDYTP